MSRDLFIRKLGARPRVLGLVALLLTMAAPAAVRAADPACGDAIRVAPGETLRDIAWACQTTVPALRAANPAIRHRGDLRAGDLVLMPRQAPRHPPVSPVTCGPLVRVTPGDTLGLIAQRCGVATADLLAENPHLVDPNRIFVGMVLRLPAGRAGWSAAATPPVASHALRITGTMTGQGGSCQAMIGDDGQLYSFAATALRPLRNGDRVTVTATRTGPAPCFKGITLLPSQIVQAGASAAPVPAPLPAPLPRPGIDLTGTITREGVTCTAMRGDDGLLYTLAGETGGLRPGDRVRVTGELAQASFCQQGRTISLRHLQAVG